MDSILDTIKKLLGIDAAEMAFDVDVIADINTVLLSVTQLGIGPSTGFLITDNKAKWSDLIGTDPQFEAVKTYIYMKVKPMFDPTASSVVAEAMSKAVDEIEARLSLHVEELEAAASVIATI